jgi:hypothetical protein
MQEISSNNPKSVETLPIDLLCTQETIEGVAINCWHLLLSGWIREDKAGCAAEVGRAEPIPPEISMGAAALVSISAPVITHFI